MSNNTDSRAEALLSSQPNIVCAVPAFNNSLFAKPALHCDRITKQSALKCDVKKDWTVVG